MGWMNDNPHHCNAIVESRYGEPFGNDLCKFQPRWRVVFRWGIRYYCTRHKNAYSATAEKVEKIQLTKQFKRTGQPSDESPTLEPAT